MVLKKKVNRVLNNIANSIKTNVLYGVYVFSNRVTKEVYVGSSTNLRRRIGHYAYDTKDKNKWRKIIISIKQYGIENFSVEFYVINPIITHEDNKKRLIIALEQYIIFKLKPQLNIIIAANSVISPDISRISPKKYSKMKNSSGITVYVYIDNILVYQAISIINLSKVINLSTNRLFVNIKQNRLVFNKFRIRQEGPTENTVVNLLTTDEIIEYSSTLKKTYDRIPGFAVILTNSKTIFNFMSINTAFKN